MAVPALIMPDACHQHHQEGSNTEHEATKIDERLKNTEAVTRDHSQVGAELISNHLLLIANGRQPLIDWLEAESIDAKRRSVFGLGQTT